MTGRNNKPDSDGSVSSPSRLDQFGDKLSSENEDEFLSATNLNSEQACDTEEQEHQ